ncbi:MAG: protein kinase [Pirellulaceae bacterium]|nr:protein kinase [Pirellulaceae bacterium]
MNSVDPPLIRALLHARANHPTKSSLLQSLLTQLPNHNVDMQSTIDIDKSLQVVLNLAAHEPNVEAQLTNDLLEQYGFALPFDPTATDAWQSEPDTDSTVDVPILSRTAKPIDQQRSASGTPSLTHIINNSHSASVWVANDPILDRQIVLKEYEDASSDPKVQTDSQVQFLREAQITGQLEHPNIIPVYAVSWNKDGRPYYTMKHLDGDTLTERIECYHRDHTNHTLRSLRPLLDIFANVCRAISYAHNRGVIHRDIKPANIGIGSYGEVMVIDWGLGATPTTLSEALSTKPTTSATNQQDPSQTLHGDYQGTPNYMSPEQATGDTVTRLTDVYSLGGILYSIFTGRPPRSQASQSAPLSELLDAIVAGEIPTVDSIEPSIPIQLVAMVNKAMQGDQADRYQDVTSLLNDLQAVMADESIAVCPDNVAQATSRWIRKHPMLVSIASTVLALGLISLSVSNLVIDKSNEQARILLDNSRILTREAILLRNELVTEHSEEAAAKESALSSHAIALHQHGTASEQAELADSARSDAAQQLKLATTSAMEAQLASTRATKAKGEAYDALQKTDILKKKSQQLAQVIRAEHVDQLTTQAQHLIDLGRPREAILPLIKAITMPDRDADDNRNMLHSANSLMDRTVALSHIELTELFSTNLLASPQINNSPALQCISLNPANASYQLLCLPNHDAEQPVTPVVRELSSMPIAVLPIDDDDARVVVLPSANSTSIFLYPADSSKPPISFTIGLRVTSAITSHNRDQIILGTHAGGGYSFNLQTGTTKTILADVGTPITELSLHAASSIAAFATASRVHIVVDPLDAATTITSFLFPDSVSAMHFKSTKSLVVVTSRGYVIEYPELPKSERITRFRPLTSGSTLRNVSVHPNGSILLDQSSNHLTLLSNKLRPKTVQSPLTISVRSMKFTSDGLSILTTTDRRISTVWECASMLPRVLPMQSGHLVIAMEFDSVDECLYTLHSDASLRTWKLPSPEAIVPDKHTATSTLDRFQLMMSVQPSDAGLGITAVQAKMLLASRLKPDE